jgi:hypothetical protein
VLLSVPVKFSFLFAAFLKTYFAPVSIITGINASHSCKSACCFHPILTKKDFLDSCSRKCPVLNYNEISDSFGARTNFSFYTQKKLNCKNYYSG